MIHPTGKAETSKDTYSWDVFLAAPMASLSSDTYKQTTDNIKEIKRVLEIECGIQKVFFEGSNLDTQG